jgi:hypothetical protein
VGSKAPHLWEPHLACVCYQAGLKEPRPGSLNQMISAALLPTMREANFWAASKSSEITGKVTLSLSSPSHSANLRDLFASSHFLTHLGDTSTLGCLLPLEVQTRGTVEPVQSTSCKAPFASSGSQDTSKGNFYMRADENRQLTLLKENPDSFL